MKYKIGDKVVYRKRKFGTKPGPRAKNVTPSVRGDDYSYQVEKFWKIVDFKNNELVLETRTGKRHVVSCMDKNLRKAGWFTRWWYKKKFDF